MDEEGRLISRVRRKAGSAKRRLAYALGSWQITNLYVMQLTYAEMSDLRTPGVEVLVREITEKDNSALDAVARFGFYGSRDFLEKCLRNGQHCYVAEVQGKPVCYNWRATDKYYDFVLKRCFRLSPHEDYLLGAYTVPEFRGMGILPYLIKTSSEQKMRNSSALKAIGFMRVNNKAMERSLMKLGWIRVGRVGFIECFGIRWNFLIGRGVLPKTVKRNFISLPAWK